MKFNNDPELTKRRIEEYKRRKDDPSGGNKDFLFKEKVNLFQSRDGENIIRILPAAWEDALFPWMEVFVHYSIGANNGQFFCPAKCPGIANYACPICEEAKAMADGGAEQEQVRPLYPSHRAIAWVVDRADPAKGPQVWVMPYKGIAAQIIKISMKRNGEPVFIDNIKEGYDLIFSKQGKGIGTKYDGIRKDDDPSPLNSDTAIASKWLSLIEEKNIPSLMLFKPYDHIKLVLAGLSPTPTVEEAPKPNVSASSTTKPKKAASANHSNGNGNGLSRQSLSAMDRGELTAFLAERGDIDINPDDWADDADLVSAIAIELNLE